MRVTRHDDAASFLACAGAFLLANDAVNGLAYGIASRVRDGTQYGKEGPLFATVHVAEAVVLAALRTPPYNIVLSTGPDAAAKVLAGSLAETDVALPGVSGPRGPSMAFADTFAARKGLEVRERIAQQLFTIREVTSPRPGPGSARPATAADRPRLIDWFRAFDEEAVGDGSDPAQTVDRHLELRSAHIYEDDGAPVSMLVAMTTTERGVRIGGVYTPPALRARGYASRLVADITQMHLDDGADYVSLFTDLSNPTSNAIYQALGYAPVAPFSIIDFA